MEYYKIIGGWDYEHSHIRVLLVMTYKSALKVLIIIYEHLIGSEDSRVCEHCLLIIFVSIMATIFYYFLIGNYCRMLTSWGIVFPQFYGKV